MNAASFATHDRPNHLPFSMPVWETEFRKSPEYPAVLAQARQCRDRFWAERNQPQRELLNSQHSTSQRASHFRHIILLKQPDPSHARSPRFHTHPRILQRDPAQRQHSNGMRTRRAQHT
jgi:hypothetical protein